MNKDINKNNENKEEDFDSLNDFENDSEFDLDEFDDFENDNSIIDSNKNSEEDFEEELNNTSIEDEFDDFEEELNNTSIEDEFDDFEDELNNTSIEEDFDDFEDELNNTSIEEDFDDFEEELNNTSIEEDFDDFEEELNNTSIEEDFDDFEEELNNTSIEEDFEEDIESLLLGEEFENKKEDKKMNDKNNFDLDDFDDEEEENEVVEKSSLLNNEIEEDLEEEEMILKTSIDENENIETNSKSKLPLIIASILGTAVLGGGAYYYLNFMGGDDFDLEEDLRLLQNNTIQQNQVQAPVILNEVVENNQIQLQNQNIQNLRENTSVNIDNKAIQEELNKKLQEEAKVLRSYIDNQLLTMGRTITNLDNRVNELTRENRLLRNNNTSIENLSKQIYNLESSIDQIRTNNIRFENSLNEKIRLTMQVTKKVYEDSKKLDQDRGREIINLNRELSNIKFMNNLSSNSPINDELIEQIELLKERIQEIKNSQDELYHNYYNKINSMENSNLENKVVEQKEIVERRSVVDLLTETRNVVARENNVTIPLSVTVENNNQRNNNQANTNQNNNTQARSNIVYELVGVIENTLYLRNQNNAIAGYVIGEFLPGYGRILDISNDGVVKTENGIVNFSR